MEPQNYLQYWDALREKYEAKVERLDAERRLEANSLLDDYRAEFDAATDWTEASWNEFTAKLDQAWQERKLDD